MAHKRTPAVLKRMIHYGEFKRTGDVQAAIAAAEVELRKSMNHSACWKQLFKSAA